MPSTDGQMVDISIYVTRGIGESAFKARFACRPEIAILDLSP